MNHEIVYERNPTGSYMKIFSNQEENLDEKILLRRKIPGLLPMEKAYLDGNGQYWYNISGKQSLDTYCSIQNVGIDVIKKIIISICSQMEILEWNLISMGSLLLEPECIFVTNSNQEFIFTSYPGAEHNVEDGFRQLMEYLLTKVDHKDALAVRAAYGVYEKSLEKGMAIRDVRDWITQSDSVEQTEKKVLFEEPSADIAGGNVNQREVPAIANFMEEKPIVQSVQENRTYHSENFKKQDQSKDKKKQWDSFLKEKFSSLGFKTAEKTKKKKKRKSYDGQKIQNFSDLKPGDYVVHENHGLGIYRGIEKIEVDKVTKDYMKISYADGGNLYILATQLDLIQKYASADAKKPKLNRLGGQEWKKTKTRVKIRLLILSVQGITKLPLKP